MAIKSTTIHIDGVSIQFLEERGARASRGGGTFNRSQMLTRYLRLLRQILEQADPARQMPPELIAAAVGLLKEPWDLNKYSIEKLADYLRSQPGFAELGKRGEQLVQAVDRLGFAERAALVDLAFKEHGPVASKAEAEAAGRELEEIEP
ncbi:MAG: hypothetical protein M3O15_06370 [Acidobacteriota bacterium]|nr:hypothetical protein [Acidobacteriota bacterium]